ncbi:unnamed protein product [Bursaphelenchus xylophilus]|uniref:glucuronosyltransferase n=1 Tax=Bursaphelenchus xylophilus TaxID=6326 RepID=A0A1I7SW05_BURXY|nr:unnamed protein product [Bursaphelenchus xylophilus]CAG9098605.1 unnamed protein product [Bursaphelenchus xylophilus]
MRAEVSFLLLVALTTVSGDRFEDNTGQIKNKRLKIFVDSPSIGYSHMQFQGRLADLLVDRGHLVDVYISNFNPNERRTGTSKARVFRINATTETRYGEMDLFTDPFNAGSILFQMKRADPYRNTTAQLCYDIVNHPSLIDQIRAENYDVIIAEMFDPCIFYLAEYLQIRTRILSSAMPTPDLVAQALGIPVPRSYIPSVFSSSADVPNLGWMERLFNVITDFYHPIVLNELTERMRNMYKDRFGVDMAEFKDLLRKSSYLFVNVHDQLDHPRPITRKVQYIGGIAVKKPQKKHTQEIEEIFSRPSKGVILFSMGSVIDSTLMPVSMKNAFVDTFDHFKDYTFLWRIKFSVNDTHRFRNISNLFTIDWMDQPTILADPRTKLFITHCGQNSMMEAAYNGVPVLGFPLWADQHYNNALLINRGVALHQDTHTTTSESLIRKISTILNDESYYRNAQILKRKLEDEPFKPEDRFIGLIEYAARHEDKGELNLYVNELTFVRRNNLDIYIPMVLIAYLTFYTAKVMLFRIWNQLSNSVIYKQKVA